MKLLVHCILGVLVVLVGSLAFAGGPVCPAPAPPQMCAPMPYTGPVTKCRPPVMCEPLPCCPPPCPPPSCNGSSFGRGCKKACNALLGAIALPFVMLDNLIYGSDRSPCGPPPCCPPPCPPDPCAPAVCGPPVCGPPVCGPPVCAPMNVAPPPNFSRRPVYKGPRVKSRGPKGRPFV